MLLLCGAHFPEQQANLKSAIKDTELACWPVTEWQQDKIGHMTTGE